MGEARRPAEAAGIAYVVISALAFGTLGIFGRLAERNQLSVATLLTLRFAGAALLLWPLARLRGEELWPGWRRAGGLCLMGVLYAAQATAFFSSLRTIPVAVTSILLYVYPVVVTLLARLLFGERLTRLRLAALAFASAGVVLVAGPGPSGHLDLGGVVLGLVSAAIYSTYILLGSVLLRGVAALTAMAYIASVAAVAFAAGGGGLGQLHGFRAAGWGVVAGIIAIPTLVAATAFIAGLARVGPARSSILSTLEPATTAVLAALVLGETLAGPRLLGGALVLVAAVLLARREPAVVLEAAVGGGHPPPEHAAP